MKRVLVQGSDHEVVDVLTWTAQTVLGEVCGTSPRGNFDLAILGYGTPNIRNLAESLSKSGSIVFILRNPELAEVLPGEGIVYANPSRYASKIKNIELCERFGPAPSPFYDLDVLTFWGKTVTPPAWLTKKADPYAAKWKNVRFVGGKASVNMERISSDVKTEDVGRTRMTYLLELADLLLYLSSGRVPERLVTQKQALSSLRLLSDAPKL